MSGVDIEDRENASRRPLLLTVLLILVVFLSVLGAARAWGGAHDEWSADPVNPSPVRVYLTGDSIAYWSAPYILNARPRWHLEGVPGRDVQDVGLQVAQILAADPNPRAIIIELGTNTTEWTNYETLYRDALALVPATTKVVLVTPYRNPRKFDADYEAHLRAFHQYYVARAMNKLAAEADNVCLARWRYLVSRNRDLLHDGVHPTLRGRSALAGLLVRAVRECR